MVEFNLENISELKRVVKLEMEGALDNETLSQFVEAWVHDGFRSNPNRIDPSMKGLNHVTLRSMPD